MTRPGGARVREADTADLDAIAAIYAHAVRHSVASFEEVPPGRAEMEERYRAILAEGLPYLVAELEAEGVRGYAYAGLYHRRPGYRYTLENSVYIAPEAQGRGLGRALLSALIERCTALGYRQMIAVIGLGETRASVGLHEALGFRPAGTLAAVGLKFGRWIDCAVLQRPLGQGAETLPERAPDRL